MDEAPILIQFLNGAAGAVGVEEIFGARVSLEISDNLEIAVMHPVHALQSKMALLAIAEKKRPKT